MSLHHKPRIVTDGLVLYLDAANKKSYPGTGTAWFDLSKEGKFAIISGTVEHKDFLAGSLTFAQNSDIVEIPDSYNQNSIPTGNSSRTIICAFTTGDNLIVSDVYSHLVHYGSKSANSAFGLAIYNDGDKNVFSNHTWSGTSIPEGIEVQTNTTYIVSVTYNDQSSPRTRFNINGEFYNTTFGQGKTDDYSINTGSVELFRISGRIGTPVDKEPYNSDIHLVKVYDRALSDSEIKQNFNALRGRFGI